MNMMKLELDDKIAKQCIDVQFDEAIAFLNAAKKQFADGTYKHNANENKFKNIKSLETNLFSYSVKDQPRSQFDR